MVLQRILVTAPQPVESLPLAPSFSLLKGLLPVSAIDTWHQQSIHPSPRRANPLTNALWIAIRLLALLRFVKGFLRIAMGLLGLPM